MSNQLHKNFTDGQVKSLFEKYSKKEIKLNYILQILRIKRSRFFELLTRYRKDPDNFSIQYKRNTSNYRIDREIEANIIQELKIEKGYLSALKEARINWKKELAADFRLDTAYQKIMHHWPQLNNSDELPTAIFAANDLMAIGALKAFAQLKVRVPEDISIIGFDNIPFSDCTHPPLTTIAQPTYQMGQKAVETLLKLIDKKKIKKSVEFETELIERDSVCRQEV